MFADISPTGCLSLPSQVHSAAAIRANGLAQAGSTGGNFDDLHLGVPLPVAGPTTGVLSPP